ncbi:MAG: M20/M25/M40 family metallo-hydrolase [Pyrinomonadaceae bacterium]|nr:M20/M25/M40 family metallo-hydrolase [Blastocatellia bacterium]MCW5958104.1 M20/M25/M40 family metallo-hydrolase [Pyrinomonadaceae bacterium]
MKTINAALSLILTLAFLAPSLTFAQTATTEEINAKIRKEGMENSKIMNTMHYFTDLYGPRLTGSPNHVNAAKWGAAEMRSWGFDNTFLEPWDFGHPGWVNERNTGMIVAPFQDTLSYEVLAWTPSTKGAVTGDAFHLVIPQVPAAENPRVMQNPTQEELTAYFNSIKSSINGKMVLVGKPTFIDQSTPQTPKRIADDVIKCRVDPTKTPADCAALGGGPGGPGGPGGGQRGPQVTPRPNALTPQQISDQLDAFLLANGVLVRINESQLDRGLVRAFNNRTFDITKVVPTVVMRNEDFGRIVRLLAHKTPVKLEFDLRSRIMPEGTTSYNMIGEIFGSDKKDEVIMLGGHLDSWHSATGATDNAIGCATMMEAARILKAIGVKPRRTIRVACWGGEEQGLLGSQAYVKKHFGSFENPTPEYAKFGGYFNIDSGTGKARALSVFGPPETATVLREALASFGDLGFAGVTASASRGLGGTDSTSFNNAGLPGIGTQQDPIEYFAGTWHTNIDTYERIIEDDVKKSAVIFAAAVYQLAMRDELLPRFPADKMPKPPQQQ